MKTGNKNFQKFEEQAALAATGSDKPYAAMIKFAGLAASEGAITSDDRDAFYDRLEKARPSATHKTMLDSRKSEAWSCVKLAFEYKHCAAAIFANIESATPTPTGVYDIACSIRGKAHFAQDAYKSKAINLHGDSAVAPTVEAMKKAITTSNSYRNGLSGASNARPLASVVGSMAKTLESFRDGKRDPKTGKPAKGKDGKAITLPKLTSDKLGDVIAALRAYEGELAKPRGNGNIVQLKRAMKKSLAA